MMTCSLFCYALQVFFQLVCHKTVDYTRAGENQVEEIAKQFCDKLHHTKHSATSVSSPG